SDEPRYLAYYAQALLRRQDVDQAEIWLAKLEKQAPDAWITIKLKAHLLQARNQGTEAAALVLRHAEEKDASELVVAAVFLDELGQFVAAEKLYRTYLVRSDRPENVFALAQNLARQRRLDEAVALAKQAWQNCPVDVASIGSVMVLHLGGA